MNNTQYWRLDGTTGHFGAVTDNVNDIGASGANRPRTLYAGTSVVVGASVGTISIESSGLKFVSGGVGVAIGTGVGGTTYNFNATALNFNGANAVDIGSSGTPAKNIYAGTSVVSPAYTVGSTAGCSGTPTAVTNGIATTCVAPSPTMFPGYVLLTQDEYADFQALRALLPRHQ